MTNYLNLNTKKYNKNNTRKAALFCDDYRDQNEYYSSDEKYVRECETNLYLNNLAIKMRGYEINHHDY